MSPRIGGALAAKVSFAENAVGGEVPLRGLGPTGAAQVGSGARRA